MFRDRTDAGEQLAERLAEQDIAADVVLGIPRGALPLARPVADALDADLDIAAAKKMSAPHREEYAIGAAASDGSVWRNEEAIRRLSVDEDYVEAERERAAETAREKAERYREDGPISLEGKTVVLVDDGVATGATVTACLRMIRARGADRVILAVPVGPPDTMDRLREEADEVVVLREPERFRAVGQYYETFGQVTDEEAIAYLRGEA